MITHNSGYSSITQWLIRKIGLLGLGALLAGCGGGGSFSPGTSSGDVSISLTDASGDFAAYTVDVTSLQLVKQNGTKVSALPTTARVDFTQYTDLSEFLTVASVPSGNYTQVILNLNYSNADVEVQDSTGAVQKATLQDSSGNPLTTLSVTLNLDSGNPLVIAPGIPASLALDFDLSASNQVDFTQSPPVVQVEPFVVADLSLDTSREHRARGLLKDVDQAAQTFDMHLRPFAVREQDWGLISMNCSSTTHYEIDGVGYDGATGLTQLAAMSVDTPLIVTGTIAGKKSLDATEVLAGTSVPWSNKDVVQGTVIKRSGDTLTVRGHYINRLDGVAIFNSDISVTVDSATKITAPLSNQTALTKDSISVGQAVTAFGTLDLNSTPYALDSTGTDNLVRMDVTQLKGTVNTQNGGLLNTDLAYIEGRRIGIFDFSGTGTTPADDSDPTSYDVDTGSLLASKTISSGDIVKIRGFVAPFGQASTSDFSAISVIDLNQDALGANLALRWVLGTSSAFSNLASDSITINLSGVSSSNLWLAGVGVNLGSTAAIMLQPQDPSSGHYAIKQRGQVGITFYQKFADFSAALTAALGNGARVVLVVAHGSYSSADTTLSSSGALVLLTR
jgi:Domain of unknown function (DUF4382)